MRVSFRTVCTLAKADRFDEAQRELLSLPRSRADYRHESIRGQSLGDFPTLALSPTGELPATHLASCRPFQAAVLDGDAFKPHLVWLNDPCIGQGTAALQLCPSYAQFHWITGAPDLASKLDEHLAAILPRAGLRKVEPQPEGVPQFNWGADKPSNPVLLSTGHIVRVTRHGTRAGYPAHTLHLAHFWNSQADIEGGKPPMHVQDFETQWNGAHDNPGGRMQRILERYCRTHDLSKPAGLLAEGHWSDERDTHGNLTHPTMGAFKAVTQ
jgi:hypothetical protein